MRVFASRELRTSLRVTGVFLLCLGAGVLAYVLLGHRLLAAAYAGMAMPLVGRVAIDRSIPLAQYLVSADQQATLLAVTAFLSFLFYLLLVLVIRRLLRNEVEAPHAIPTRPDTRPREAWTAALIYSLVTISFFYAVIPHLSTRLIGPPGDNMQHLWDIWWARTALHHRLDFLHATSIYWPGGFNLLFHPFSTYNLLVASTVARPLPPVLAYNLLILSTFVLAGLGAFLLIRHFVNNTAAALLGGFVFAFSPTHFAHALHQIEIASLQFIPFFVLFYLKALEGGPKRNVVWASVFFLLNTLCSWYYMVFALFCMAVSYCIMAYRRKKLLLRGPIIVSLAIVGITFVIVSPLAVRMLFYAMRHPGVSTWGYDEYVVDLLGPFVPDRYHWLGGVPAIARINGSYSGFPWESAGYLGVVSVGFLLASSRALLKQASRHVLALLFFVVLSLGASLHFLGRSLPVILPYAAIQYVPVISEARAPNRAMPYAYLFLGLLVALAFSYQLREGFLRNRTWVAVLLTLGIGADFWSPCRQVTAVQLPRAYSAIMAHEQSRDFGILDLPRGSWSRRARYMMYQTLHGIPIVQGYMTRKTSPSLLDTLAYDDLELQREQLRSAHVKYVVIHKRYLERDKGQWNELDTSRYLDEYRAFFRDSENLVLRVYY
jgi:hypothetical protein